MGQRLVLISIAEPGSRAAFQQAQELAPAASNLNNMARCLAELDRRSEAIEMIYQFLATPDLEPQRRARARGGRARMSPRVCSPARRRESTRVAKSSSSVRGSGARRSSSGQCSAAACSGPAKDSSQAA